MSKQTIIALVKVHQLAQHLVVFPFGQHFVSRLVVPEAPFFGNNFCGGGGITKVILGFGLKVSLSIKDAIIGRFL